MASISVERREEVENHLDEVLKSGKIREIKREVNPRVLKNCKTNSLIKALKVSEKLRVRAKLKGPESHEFEKLANYVESFSCALLEKFEEDEELCAALKDNKLAMDMLIETAIATEQKKFLCHAVIFSFLMKKWYGPLFSMAHAPWTSFDRWKWRMMCLWSIFDVVLSPVIITLLFLVKMFQRCLKRRRIPTREGSQVNENRRSNDTTNMQLELVEVRRGRAMPLSVNDDHTRDAEPDQATPQENDAEPDQATPQGSELRNSNCSLLDCYMKKYFTTPFFLFIKDSVSYLVLLSLHFAMCLQGSSIRLTTLEWFILVFFSGRVANEISQLLQCKNMDTGEKFPRGKCLARMIRMYFCDLWNCMDFVTILVYLVLIVLRIVTWIGQERVQLNVNLNIANVLYGINTLFLTFRAFGQIMESKRRMGIIQISLLKIVKHILAIFWQFAAAILAFSFAITKVFEAERSFMSEKNVTKSYCRKDGVECWWKTVKHLIWSLFNLVELSDLSSQRTATVIVARTMYVLYLVLAVIMLVNMMIALLSNTYQQVQDNAMEEWGFKKAITIQTYSNCHPIVAPMNLLSLPIYFIIQKCRKSSNMYRLTREFQRKEFNDLVQKELEPSYFSKFGFEFPPNDDDKRDAILGEVTGNRSISNHIAESVFTSGSFHFPTGDEAWYSEGIEIIGNRLFNSSPSYCTRCRNRTENPSEFHGARYKFSLSKDYPYFEVLLQDTGERRLLAIGLVYRSHILHILPGWETRETPAPTVGYHVDDGRIFDAQNPYEGRDIQGAMAYRGNVVGCKAIFGELEDRTLPVVFTLNGKQVCRTSMLYDPNDEALSGVYPYIGIWDKDVSVVFKMFRAEDVQVTRCTPGPTDRCTSCSRTEELLKDLDEQCKKQKEITQELIELIKEREIIQ